MRDKLPASVLTRSKQGFDIPTHHWFRTILKPLLLETINRESVEAAGVFHWPAVHRAIADHIDRRANYGYHLWGLLLFSMEEAVGDRRPLIIRNDTSEWNSAPWAAAALMRRTPA